jgi:hypothetical protein
MEGFDQFGLQNDVLSEAGFEAYEAAKMQRTNDIRAMQLDTISLSQQLGLRQEGFAEDNAEETVTLVDGPFTTFLDIPQLPLLAARKQAHKLLLAIDQQADILLPPAGRTSTYSPDTITRTNVYTLISFFR